MKTIISYWNRNGSLCHSIELSRHWKNLVSLKWDLQNSKLVFEKQLEKLLEIIRSGIIWLEDKG